MATFVDRAWIEAQLCDRRPVAVALTPNGLADAVVAGEFCLPHQESMPFERLANLLQQEASSPDAPVYYYQAQNNNLRDEFKALFHQVPPHIPFVTDSLGSHPDAINFWCGSARAVTSFHKDHYENVYAVLSGSKTFHLIPPTEAWALEERTFPASQYTLGENGSWTREPVYIDATSGETSTTPGPSHSRMTTRWCSLDPTADSSQAQCFRERVGLTTRDPLCVTVTLYRGDVLYLPALWAHKVTQGPGRHGDGSATWCSGAVAVNYWYDMNFASPVFLLHRILRDLAAEAGYMEADVEA
ncbi:cupin-like domain-containing protein, partial [Chytriomyces sp. MP71]